MIELKNITKKYTKRSRNGRKYVQYALDNVSVNISTGKITAVLGVNGSGKSTMLKIISGLVKPTDGSVYIDGEKISEDIYNKLIFVPDCETHFSRFTVEDMTNFYKDFYKTWNQKKADDMIEFFKIDKNNVIDSMSKGNIAKVKIMLSFALDLKYILLDEPFNGIDIFKREEFVGIIARFMDEEQAIIITTHEIDEIEHIVDDVIILSDGRAVLKFDAEEMRLTEGKSIKDKIREVSIDE